MPTKEDVEKATLEWEAGALGRANPVLAAIFGVVALILAATQFVAPVADLFGFGRVNGGLALIIAVTGIAALILLERIKPFWQARLRG